MGRGVMVRGVLLAMAGRVAGAMDNLWPARSTIGHDAAGGRSKSFRKITIAA